MKILFLSAEVAPLAKVGGLADVAGSLPKALREMGHDVRVAMPGYGLSRQHGFPIRRLDLGLNIPLGSGRIEPADVEALDLGGLEVWLISSGSFFASAESSEQVYGFGPEAYVFFAKAALAACQESGWIPDVVHANDWHTGLAPVLMREGPSRRTWEHVGSVFTIHNLAYQGEFGPEILDLANLPEELFTFDRLETFGAFNFLKAGCVYAGQVNTVSPGYAREIQTEAFGCRLHGLMAHLADDGRLSGILNGIDTDFFDPDRDPTLAAPFGASDPSGKAKCRAAFMTEIDLDPIPGLPLAGVVSRLSEQKGMDLLLDAASHEKELPFQLYVQGIGDPWLAERFAELQTARPNHVRFVNKFDANLAQRAYAGCDVFLMPSAFEPCGLGQMIAMRYGTVPVVRETGGLADTVFEGRNGFVFTDRSPEAFEAAIGRAVRAYSRPVAWAKLMRAGMETDVGWTESAAKYGDLYRRSVDSRHIRSAAS